MIYLIYNQKTKKPNRIEIKETEPELGHEEQFVIIPEDLTIDLLPETTIDDIFYIINIHNNRRQNND